MGLNRHTLLAAVQHFTPLSNILIAAALLIPGLLLQDTNMEQLDNGSIEMHSSISTPLVATNNGPLCAGQTLELTATDGADSYSWVGPNGFTSNEQNPVIPDAPLDLDGIFTVTAVGGACPGVATTGAEIKVFLNASAGSNSPVCIGDNIEFFSSGGVNFTWFGPNNFFSNAAGPIIFGAEPGDAGTYTAIVGTGICKDTINVVVEVLPTVFVTTNITPADCTTPGAIELNISGGIPPYSVDWADLPGNDNPEDRTALATGSYDVTVYDDSGCGLPLNDLIVGDFCGCDADAGGIDPDDASVCLENGTAILSATVAGNQSEPLGYNTAFVLTQGTDLIIIDVDTDPTFTVSAEGSYTIHTLIYDSNTLDLSIVQLGVTPATAVLGLILQGGGSICASLDVGGAPFQVSELMATINGSTNATCNICNGTASLSPSNNAYEWSDNGFGANRSDLCAGNFTITATDFNGCSTTLNLTIGDDCDDCIDPPTVLNIVVVESNCGESTGTVLIEMDDNPANYDYTWNPNTGTSTGSGNGRVDLPSDIYDVTITDNTDPDCETIVTIPVGIADGPAIQDIISVPANCSMSDGSITILPDSYTYIWNIDNFQGNNRSDLTTGPYDVEVIDPQNPNCPDFITVQVGQVNNLDAEAIINNQPSCGEADGVVSINMLSGGGGNLSYQWSNGGTSATETNLTAGTYGVLITDLDSGCSFNLIFGLSDDVFPATVTVDPFYVVSCVGSTDGEVTPDIDFDDDFVDPANIIITGVGGAIYTNGQLGPGQYCIVVEDGNGCIAGTACFNVIQPAALDVDVTITAADCLTQGSLSVSVSGGTPPYIFDWADLPGTDDPQNRSSVPEGEYNLTVTDQSSCTVEALNLVVADNCTTNCTTPPVINNLIIVDANCDQEDGQAIINLTTNFADYTYDWSPNIGQSNAIGNSRSNLPAGSYTITITEIDDPTCFLIETFAIGNVDGPQVSVESTTPSACSVSNGSAILTTLPGLTYNWSDGGFGPERFDLSGIEYQVTVTDVATGCFTIVTIDITFIDELIIEIETITEPDCNASNGAVSATVTGGSGDYFYSWGPGATLDNLSSGTYEVTVTDLSTGCTGVQIFTLTDDVTGASITVNPLLELDCPGAMDGLADPTIIYEAGFDFPESVSIVDADGNTYIDGQLGEGSYCVIVEDVNGCLAATECFEVVASGQIDVNVSIEPVTCTGAGSIDLEVTGTNGPYLYDWADLPGAIDPPDRFGLAVGFYTVTITDADGCEVVANDLEVLDDCNPQNGCDNPIVTNVVTIEATCGNNNGSATVDLSGNEATDYNYIWSPNISNTNEISNVPFGVYTLIIEDINDDQCSTEITIVIENTDGPEAEVTGTSAATCNQENGTAVVSPVGFIYEWCNGGGGFNGLNLPAGICYVTVTDPFTGCSNILEVEIESVNTLNAEIEIEDNPGCGSNNGTANVLVSGGSANYAYAWSDGGTGQSRSDLTAGIYSVTVTDLGVTGCEVVLDFVITNEVATTAIITFGNGTGNTIVSCTGTADGLVDFSVDTSDPAFPGPPVITIEDAAGITYVNGILPPGNYCIIVRDADDCIAGSECFEVLSPDAFELNVSLSNQTCDLLGAITLETVGGTAPFLYDWEDLPGTDDPVNRINLIAGSYNVTVTDANGCTAVAAGLAIIDECLSCPSTDSVQLVLPVFAADSFCVIIESCFDSTTTTFELLGGGLAGSSTDGFWSLNPVGCLFYFSTGNIGQDIDTIYVLANDNGLIDTTCIFVTVTPPCFGLTGLDSVSVSTFDCDLGSSFCLPVPLTQIGQYSFEDNGLPYAGGFQGCDFQMVSTYNLFELLFLFPDGPYELDSWIVNTDTFTLVSFDNLQQLVAQMNIWDPAGGWFLNLSGAIQGGFVNNTYGFLDITHISTNISFTEAFSLGTVNIPVGTLLSVDTGYHEIVMTEISTGCTDTIFVDVTCNNCPDIYTGPSLIETELCDELTMVCTELSVDDIDDYLVTDNGMNYTTGFMGCEFDSLYTYLTVDFNAGAFVLDSWIVNGTPFFNVNFSNLQQLVDSMNVWDAPANWMINGVVISGGSSTNVYGDLVVTQNGMQQVEAPTVQLIPNGVALQLEVGPHELIFNNTISGCIDTVNIEIACVECNDYTGPGLLFTFNCDEDGQLCLDIPVSNLSNYVFTDNGQPYVGSLLGCDFDTLYAYSAIDFNIFGGYTVQSWTINGNANFLGFFTTLDELVFWMNNIDPGGSWTINGFLLQGGNTANTYGNLVVTSNGLPVADSPAQIQLTPNGVGLDLSIGSHEVIVADTVIGCLDTIDVVVQCLTEGIPDTIYLDILNGFTDTFCIDIDYLPGDLDTIYNFCEGSNLEINTEVFLLDSLACFEFTGLSVGQDTACFAFCDNLGNCDTLYTIITVNPPGIDTILTTVILTDTDTLCLDVSEIPGDMYTITNLCPGESGDFVLFSTQADTVCILYTGVNLGIDTACFEICDELGYCDTTILIVETILDPDGIGPVAVDDDTIGLINMATIINVIDNDTLNGTLADITILTDPVNGIVVVNPDFTISYIPNAEFCGSLDSFEYILTTSSGSDTASVYIDVYCDELTVFTGFSPNFDGVNDGFIIQGVNNFPDNKVRIFNRWGNEVFIAEGYRNDDPWQGTWKGKDLPDGTYFYHISDGEGRDYTGYIQIMR